MKITDYERVNSVQDSDVLLIDGNRGTKTINVNDFHRGHAILDEDGTTYPQRSKLQFEGCEVTDDSTNGITKIKAEDYEEDIESLQHQLTDQTNVLGAKNLIPYPYYRPDSYTVNGITFTVNSDNSITANGTATETVGYHCRVRSNPYDASKSIRLIPGKKYILSGCPKGGNSETYSYSLYLNGYIDGTTNTVPLIREYGEGITFTERTDVTVNYGILCEIASGVTVTNLTFKPMLRLASDPDNTYVPYAMTNRELTEGKLDSSVAGVAEDGTAAKVAHEYGTHFVKNGKYCRALDYIGIGGTFSLNTNYIEETITNAYDTKYITSSTDLNTLFNPGYYMWASSKPINTPDSVTYCIMRVIVSSGVSRIQIIYCGAKMYQRIYTSQGWQSWYKFTGTVVS